MLESVINNLEFSENLFVPSSFQKDLAMQKNLLDEKHCLSNKYFRLQSLYHYYLELYLNEVLDIRYYDQLFANSTLEYQPVSLDEKDVYQARSQFRYYYVRNTLYIEKLSLEDLNFLEKCYEHKENCLTDELRAFIQRTFPFVLVSEINPNAKVTNYGPLSSVYFAPVDALILGFRYDLDHVPNNGKSWRENNFEQITFLQSILEEQANVYKEKMNVPIKIMVYEDEDVIKLSSVSNNKVVKK